MTFTKVYFDPMPKDYCPHCKELGIALDPVEEEMMDRIHRHIHWRESG